MKLLVFLLVLGNLLFYAFSTGLIGTSGGGEEVRVGQQINPESIRIVARGDAPPPVAATPATPEPEVEKPAEALPASPEAAPVCLAWAALAPVAAERVARVVSGGFADFKLERRPAGESTGWWVHIPPLVNKAAADKKAQELKALGVSDYFVVQEGATRNAISLGIFSSEKGGRERLAELQAQGVRSAKLVPRPDKDGNQQIELRGPADRRAALLAALAEALPKTPPQDCP